MRMSLLRFGLTAGSLVLPLASASQVSAGHGIIDEVKLGFLAADTGIGGSKVENGLDINGEVLFTAPQWFVSPDDPVWLRDLLAPRPTFGFTANTAGGTSFINLNLNWSWNLANNILDDHDGIYASFEFGGALNNSDLNPDPNDSDHKDMGTRGLFHLAAELGYDFDEHMNVSVYYEHFSNAGLSSTNPGMNNVGLRLGYKF
jgi:lipid A 3-O-deacylase